jgi:hypothetical protein
MKPRFAVYVKLRGEWQPVSLKKDRAAAFRAYDDLGDREKKMEKLEVTFVWGPEKIGQP